MKLEFSRQIFKQYPNIKFHENPSESRVSRCDQTDGRTDVKHVFETWPCKKNTNQISWKSQWEPSFTMRSDERTDGQTWTMYLTHDHARNIQTKFHENPSESRVSRCGQTDGRTNGRTNGRTDRRKPCIWHMAMQETYKPNFMKIPMRAEFRDAVRRTDGQT